MSRATTKVTAGRSNLFRSEWPKAAWRRGRLPAYEKPRGRLSVSYQPPERDKLPGGFDEWAAGVEATESEMATQKRAEEAAAKAVEAIGRIGGNTGTNFFDYQGLFFDGGIAFSPITIPDTFRERVTNFKYRCVKCGLRPSVDMFMQESTREIVLQFSCHGERDQWLMSEAIMASRVAFEKIQPFSRISAGTKKLERPLIPNIEVKVSTGQFKIGDLVRDNDGKVVAIVSDMEANSIVDQYGVTSAVAFAPVYQSAVELRDDGIIYGSPKTGDIVVDPKGRPFARIEEIRSDRVRTRFIDDLSTVGEYLTEKAFRYNLVSDFAQLEIEAQNREIIEQFRREGLAQPWPPPSISFWVDGKIVILDTTGMSMSECEELRRRIDLNPELMATLYRRGMLSTNPKPQTSPTGKQMIQPREREERSIDLAED